MLRNLRATPSAPAASRGVTAMEMTEVVTCHTPGSSSTQPVMAAERSARIVACIRGRSPMLQFAAKVSHGPSPSAKRPRLMA